ncbi:MAG TPA: hypothetical protein VK607_10685 [Kofleriaceae bacterium]|nr:hypothetical protein [Kofleriaceae bacterium]
MYANTRRMVEGMVAKAGGQAGSPATPPAASTGSNQAPSAGATLADVERLIARRDEFAVAIAGKPLNGGQLQLMQRAFGFENPPDVAAWVTSYLSMMNPTQMSGAAGAAATPPGPTGPPASDGGGQAAPARSLDGVNLFTMSEADRAHLIREKGLDWYRKTLQEQARGTTVKLR